MSITYHESQLAICTILINKCDERIIDLIELRDHNVQLSSSSDYHLFLIIFMISNENMYKHYFTKKYFHTTNRTEPSMTGHLTDLSIWIDSITLLTN